MVGSVSGLAHSVSKLFNSRMGMESRSSGSGELAGTGSLGSALLGV